MSDHSTPAGLVSVAEHPHSAAADPAAANPAAHAEAQPDFNTEEVAGFRKDDGSTMSVIGVGLVVFFFYSLIVMIGVSLWTWSSHHQAAPAAHGASHESDEE